MAATKVITWNGIDSDDAVSELVIGEIRRQLIGETRGSSVDVPGAEGSWFFSERRGRRTITAVCHVMAETFAERRELLAQVADWFDVEGEADLVISDEPNVFYRAHVDGAPEIEEWRELGKFELTWLTQPYGFATEITEETFTADDLPLHLETLTVEDKVYGIPEFELKAIAGTILAFTLVVNGITMTWQNLDDPLSADDVITVSSVNYLITRGESTDPDLTGLFEKDDIDMAGATGNFGFIIPGENVISVGLLQGTATSIDVTVRWRRRYR